jgi:hypothetical protein
MTTANLRTKTLFGRARKRRIRCCSIIKIYHVIIAPLHTWRGEIIIFYLNGCLQLFPDCRAAWRRRRLLKGVPLKINCRRSARASHHHYPLVSRRRRRHPRILLFLLIKAACQPRIALIYAHAKKHHAKSGRFWLHHKLVSAFSPRVTSAQPKCEDRRRICKFYANCVNKNKRSLAQALN